MGKEKLWIWLSAFLLGTVGTVFSQDYTIGPGGDFPTLSEGAPYFEAGDSVMIISGTYSHGTQFLYDIHGTPGAPIVIYGQQEYAVVFEGGTEAIHLVNCSHIMLYGLVITGQTGNGINIDDGGDYSTPAHHIHIRRCLFRDMPVSGNHDFLKLSGLDDFIVSECQFLRGSQGGSGIDMVGCHRGLIEDNVLVESGVTGIQAKGGTQHIIIRRNYLKGIQERALNLGGSTGLQYFRPPLPDPIQGAFEAADLDVYSNVFVGSRAPIAYVGSVRVRVFNNTFYHPDNWVIRVLQENTTPGFLTCADNVFGNNITVLDRDKTEVNIGPNTEVASFVFAHNLWYNEEDLSWTPVLPVVDSFQRVADPMFRDADTEDFHLQRHSPSIGAGMAFALPLYDFDQTLFNNPPSIGAFEGDSLTTQADVDRDMDMVIFPNPTSHGLRFFPSVDDGKYIIFNIEGRIVQEGSVRENEIVTNLPRGVYHLEVLTHSSERSFQKLIID